MSDTRIEELLIKASEGRSDAEEDLIELVYKDLHQIAKAQIGRGANDPGTLGATALVHEAWMRLAGNFQNATRNRAYFFGAAAQAMRQVFIDHARARGAKKRGGGQRRLPLEGIELSRDGRDEELLEVDQLIESLAEEDEQLVEIVRLRFWAGLSTQETADALECSTRTIKRSWAYARARLIDSLQMSDDIEQGKG